MADKEDELTASRDALERLRKAGLMPGDREPLSEEESQPLSAEARAQLWGDAPSRGMWVVNFGTVGRIVMAVLLCIAVAAFVWEPIIGTGVVVVVVALFAGMSHRISVDRRARYATLRFGILPFVGFSYPLKTVSIDHQSTFSLTSKKSHNMLYWNNNTKLATDESGMVQPTITDGLRPRRTQLISTKDRKRVVALKRQIEALLDPPPLGSKPAPTGAVAADDD